MNRISFLNRGYAFKGLLALIRLLVDVSCSLLRGISVFHASSKLQVTGC